MDELPREGPSDRPAVVVLGRGAFGHGHAREVGRMVDALRATGRYRMVAGAFADLDAPHLRDALNACVAAGGRRILVVPVFIPFEESLREWLEEDVRRWTRRLRVWDVEVSFLAGLGEQPAVLEALKCAVAAPEECRPIRGAPRTLGGAEDAQIPDHDFQAFVCLGPSCSARGSYQVWQHLRHRVAADAPDRPNRRVLVVRTGCLNPCNLGPMMLVLPGPVWYGALTPKVVDQVIEQHFGAGQPVEANLRPRARRPA